MHYPLNEAVDTIRKDEWRALEDDEKKNDQRTELAFGHGLAQPDHQDREEPHPWISLAGELR